MDLSSLIPEIAARLHIAPSSLVFWIFVLNIAARAVARRIPDDATGFWGFVRQSAKILGVEVSSRITSGVTTSAAARAAIETAPIREKVEAATGVAISTENTPKTAENADFRENGRL